jgi:hypothetical protein
MSSSVFSSTTNVTVTTSGTGSVTCVVNGNVITVISSSVRHQPAVVGEPEIIEIPSPAAPSRPAEVITVREAEPTATPFVSDSDDDDDSDGDWETEDEESVISEDDRDPILARLKRRRIAAIEKAEKEVVARDALELGSAECLICLTNPRTVAVVPCGHIISCDPCSKKLSEMIKHADGFSTVDGTKCPTCRGDVKSLLRLYA